MGTYHTRRRWSRIAPRIPLCSDDLTLLCVLMFSARENLQRGASVVVSGRGWAKSSKSVWSAHLRNIAQAGKKAVQTLAAGCTSTSCATRGWLARGQASDCRAPCALRWPIPSAGCVCTRTHRGWREAWCAMKREKMMSSDPRWTLTGCNLHGIGAAAAMGTT